MKKFTIFLLIIALLFTVGCGAQQSTELSATPSPEIPEETPAPTPTPEPTPTPTPVPTCADALVKVDHSPAILMLLNRGDIVDVVGEFDEDHYAIKTEFGYGLVEKQLLRMSEETAYEVWQGYTKANTAFYDNYQLLGTPVSTLNLNTQCEILDELDCCYVAKVGEDIGFIQKEQVSKTYIVYSYGGGGGGGNGGGGGVGADGGDISLSFGGINLLSLVIQSGDITGTAEVLADGTQVVLAYFDRDEIVPVVVEEGFAPEWEGYYTLYFDGLYAYMPMNFALLDGAEEYAQWNGFAKYNSRVYDNRLLQGDGKLLYINTDVTVLWDLNGIYVVSVNGEIGYMSADMVSYTRIYTGGGGGGDGGGGGGGEAEWTAPVL